MSSLLKKIFKKKDGKKKEEPPKAPVAQRSDPTGHLWKALEKGPSSLPQEVIKKKQEDQVRRKPDLTTPAGTPVEI